MCCWTQIVWTKVPWFVLFGFTTVLSVLLFQWNSLGFLCPCWWWVPVVTWFGSVRSYFTVGTVKWVDCWEIMKNWVGFREIPSVRWVTGACVEAIRVRRLYIRAVLIFEKAVPIVWFFKTGTFHWVVSCLGSLYWDYPTIMPLFSWDLQLSFTATALLLITLQLCPSATRFTQYVFWTACLSLLGTCFCSGRITPTICWSIMTLCALRITAGLMTKRFIQVITVGCWPKRKSVWDILLFRIDKSGAIGKRWMRPPWNLSVALLWIKARVWSKRAPLIEVIE